MRVLFDHQVFSYQARGGISRYFAELMNQFRRIDGLSFDLALIYSPCEYLRRPDGTPFGDLATAYGRSEKLRFLARYLHNRRVSNCALRRGAYDVFHPTFFDPSCVRALGDRPYVLTLHDMTPEAFPELFPRSTLYDRLVTARWIDGKRTLARGAAKIIAISENTRSDVIRYYGVDPAAVEVVHQAGALDLSAAASAAARVPPRPFLLFVGVRSGYKNFAAFARAIAPLLERDADLVVVCVGGGAFTSAESTLLGSSGHRDRYLQFRASDAELAALYRAARAFVFPSRYEGFGIPILEAFSCGCPCAISRASSFPEIAGDAAAYFDPDDQESMTEGIRTVLDDEEHRRELVRRGLARARMFSWEATARKTVAVYEAVCR